MNNSPKRRTTIIIDLAREIALKHDGTIVDMSKYSDLDSEKVGPFVQAQEVLDKIVEEAWDDGWEPCDKQSIDDISNKMYLLYETTLFTQTLIRRQADKFPTDTRDKGIYGANLSIGFEEMSGYSDADVAFRKATDLL